MYISSILFYASLILCISMGSYYKKINDVNMKRNFGTGLGILLACLLCGHYIYHSLFMVWGNILIIKCCNRSYMHQLSLAYTWMYLLYLHLNIKNMYMIWLHQVQALRLVGLAFDIYRSESKDEARSKLNVSDNSAIDIEPTAVDIMAYSFFYVGLHKGPYFRWKIFEDHFIEPFSTLGDCWVVTEQKLKKACVCALGYFILRMKYSSELYQDPKFYQIYGAEFRFLYNIPLLVMHLLQYEFLMMLCTSVCTETCFGVYPAKCQPIPGYGPSTQLSGLSVTFHVSVKKSFMGRCIHFYSELPGDIRATSSESTEEEFNFSALKCFYNKKILLGPKMRDTIKYWDIPCRFWFWSNMYRGVFKANKEVRSAFSFLAWTIWSGPTLSRIVLSITLWVYVHLEEEYSLLYDTHGTMKLPWDIGFSIMRVLCLLYLTPCLVVDDTATVLKYYNSIFWVYHVILLVLMLSAVVIYRSRNT